MNEPHIMAAMAALDLAIEEMTAPYVPPPEEARHLDAALAHLIAAFRSRDFEPGEEAVWNCHGITIDGVFAGEWEITLRQTDCDSDTQAKPGDAKQGSASGE